jgi:ubiquinone/menaquinone biosynthesis C-methylase UbiE
MYTDFSQIYDRLMRDVDYLSWARHYEALLREYGIVSGRVCECACGTGSLTIPLAQGGYRMTGVDVSESMLARAMAKAREAGQEIPFVLQDMRKLVLHKPQDAVLATCDGVNYLLTPAAVLDFFKAAHAAVRNGGALVFDVSTPEKLTGTLGNNTLTHLAEDTAYIWENSHNRRTRVTDMRLTLFTRRADGAYDRLEETQAQRAHTREELEEWLAAAGFDDIRTYGEMRQTPPGAGDTRWHITAARK